MSATAGVVVFITLWAVNVPFALLFALWCPGRLFATGRRGARGIPTVLFAFVQSTSAGVVTLIVFVVYTLVQNHAIYPIVMSRTIKLNPCWCPGDLDRRRTGRLGWWILRRTRRRHPRHPVGAALHSSSRSGGNQAVRPRPSA